MSDNLKDGWVWATIFNAKIRFSTDQNGMFLKQDGKTLEDQRLFKKKDEKVLNRTFFPIRWDMLKVIFEAGKEEPIRKVIQKATGQTFWVKWEDISTDLKKVPLFKDKRCTLDAKKKVRDANKYCNLRTLNTSISRENLKIFDVGTHKYLTGKSQDSLEADHIPSSGAIQNMKQIMDHYKNPANGICIAIPEKWHIDFSATRGFRNRYPDTVNYSKSIPFKDIEILMSALKHQIKLREAHIDDLEKAYLVAPKLEPDQDKCIKTCINISGKKTYLNSYRESIDARNEILEEMIEEIESCKDLLTDQEYFDKALKNDVTIYKNRVDKACRNLKKYIHGQQEFSEIVEDDNKWPKEFKKALKIINNRDELKWVKHREDLDELRGMRIKTTLSQTNVDKLFKKKFEFNVDDEKVKDNYKIRNEEIRNFQKELKDEISIYQDTIQQFLQNSGTEEETKEEKVGNQANKASAQETKQQPGRLIIDGIFPEIAMYRDIKTMFENLLHNPEDPKLVKKFLKKKTLQDILSFKQNEKIYKDNTNYILELYGSYRRLYSKNIRSGKFRATYQAFSYEENPLSSRLEYSEVENTSAAKQLDNFFNNCFNALLNNVHLDWDDE